MSFNEFAKAIHQNAVEHGFWEGDRNNGECIALMHSELSEALEELRKEHAPDEVYYKGDKPEGVPIELADCIIRILDFCGKHGIDMDDAINKKMQYNEIRPYKHGKEF